ncbi:PLP-dependent aminotransferase family protein [Methanocella sp. MCL-LM]|uniref:aminotransferase-like domain-containing protein n=1 Tax=Methanocella sp. MCL-LM TaxID=3412035 RepID=UPI003C7724E5
MSIAFADRMSNVHKSFIREILKVTQDPSIISFAGGLPNPASFPVREISEAATAVLKDSGDSVLQYSTTEGYQPLREYVAMRYARRGLKVDPDEVMITSGSQQGIDLAGKVFIDKGDKVLVERPTYLATLQAFGLYQPEFKSISLLEDGPDTQAMAQALDRDNIKLFYAVPSFQNPTGITYSQKKRQEVAGLLNEHDTAFVEDDPYGEIRYLGEDLPPVKKYVENGVLLGSFSKIVSPGMRLGWLVAPKEIMEKIIIAKQATDLHTNFFTQRVVYQYLTTNDVDSHILKIRAMYRKQRDTMVQAIEKHFPEEVQYTKPEGGMFLWATLPEGISSLELFDIAIKEKVAFVPGQAFFADGSGQNTLRLNYTNSGEEAIETGIARLGNAIHSLMEQKK